MRLFRYIKNRLYHDNDTKRLLEEGLRKMDGLYYSMMNVVYQQRIDFLRGKTLSSIENGISEEKYCNHEIIVSLTSFGKRIFDVYLAIESIMQGTMKPNRIVLWLSEKEFGRKTLPITLQKQQQRGLEIKFCEDLRSYTKLIHALRQFPDACVITIDDDAIYEYDLVERLVNTHVDYPKAVCACRIHKIKLDDNCRPLSYLEWEWECEDCVAGSPLLFPTGVGGVLYPPHCFTDEVLNQKAFMELCPFADDVWFYAMELLNDIPVEKVYTGKPCYYMNLDSAAINALSQKNIDRTSCGNDEQIRMVMEHYNLYGRFVNLEVK